MLIRKSITLRTIYHFTGHHLLWLASWMFLVTIVYNYTGWKWIALPWLPVSVVGTAVAFYVGFKNNQSYERLWEGRRIWGAVVNSSRMWAAMVKSYIVSNTMDEEELKNIKRKLIFRHIGWVYTLRSQLLVPTPWEHVSLKWIWGSFSRGRRDRFGAGAFVDQVDPDWPKKYLPDADLYPAKPFVNLATQIIDKQSQQLAFHCKEGQLELLRQLEMQKVLNDFYEQQGMAERLKRFPLPRQYGGFSFIFVSIFIFLLPFGLVGEFHKLGPIAMWLAIPFGMLIGWVYLVMELIGDYSENPFEGLVNDVPMLSICRTIEVDLLQMIGETDVPPAIQPKNGVLM
ncbi:bestrophin family protein [Pollutibacter soli]|uniref:bestrophin family protein n=1 Tax=Pollutibacter soli TaxID=3034157 RepID=UPI003013A075